MLSGKTTIIAHIGYPTSTFKAPLIYNPWFESKGIDACVVPMGVKTEDYPEALKYIFKFSNIHGALITMPHKVTTVSLVDECSTTAQIAGAANAVLLRKDGTLLGDMFDGEGFVRGVAHKGFKFSGAKCLVVGSGRVGSAIAASMAAAGVALLSLYDVVTASAEKLAARLKKHYPKMEVFVRPPDPAGYDLVVNASPLGMNDDDPLPMDVSRIDPKTFVGEVVLKKEITPFLEAARARGCRYQIGTDMLFEQIPAYLEFFSFGTTTPDELRSVAKISY